MKFPTPTNIKRSASIKKYYELHPKAKIPEQEYKEIKAARAKAKYDSNKETMLAQNAVWRNNHPEEFKRYWQERKAKGWEKQEILAGRPRPSECESCGGPPSGRGNKMHFDHDHKTGLFRGWICSRCNVALGQVDDSISKLESLIAYLRRS